MASDSSNEADRIERLKRAFTEDEISEALFDELVESALDGGPPYWKTWFKSQDEARHKRYAEETVYVYYDEEYVEDGEKIVPLDREIDRTIDVRDEPELEGQVVFR